MGYNWDGYEKTGDMEEENTKEDIWSSGKTRNMKNKN